MTSSGRTGCRGPTRTNGEVTQEGHMASESERAPETRAAGSLDPPRRRPPTAVGAATPEPPSVPPRLPRSRVGRRKRDRLLKWMLLGLVEGVDDVLSHLHR